MFDLPKTSEIRKPLHKKLIYEKYAAELAGNKKDKFDADISRMIITNEISEASVNIKATEEVSSIFVLQVELKTKEYDDKNIVMISKLFGQKLLIILHYENKYQLAIYETRLLKSDWKNEEEILLKLIGKTTLLKSILGLIKPLSGSVTLGDYLEIGYFEQEMDQSVTTTCIEEIWNEFPAFSQYEVRSALAKCGLTTKHIESQVRVLSGGEQAKVRLCKLINRETNILLLDEPTNHLDVDAKDELKRALKEYKGSILMVCHEPDFYDGLATDVWDCSKWTTKL